MGSKGPVLYSRHHYDLFTAITFRAENYDVSDVNMFIVPLCSLTINKIRSGSNLISKLENLNPRGEVTRSPKQEYRWSLQKDSNKSF